MHAELSTFAGAQASVLLGVELIPTECRARLNELEQREREREAAAKAQQDQIMRYVEGIHPSYLRS